MPTYTIDGHEVDVAAGISQEEAAQIFRDQLKRSEQIAGAATETKKMREKALPSAMDLTADIPAEARKQVSADLLRTGVPLAAAALTRSPGRLALITGFSDLAASEYEDKLNSPETIELNDYVRKKAANIKQAAISGGLSYGSDVFLQPWLATQTTKLKNMTSRPLKKKILGGLVPDDPQADVATAQAFLGRIPPRQQTPFSLTLDQMHQGRKSWQETVAGMVRSGILSGKRMRASDIRNTEVASDWVESFMRASRDMTPQQFGDGLSMALGGEMDLLKIVGDVNFDTYRSLAYNRGVMTNLAPAFDILLKNYDSGFAREALAKMVTFNPRFLSKLNLGTGGSQATPMIQTLDQATMLFNALPEARARKVIEGMPKDVPIEVATDLYRMMNRIFRGKADPGTRRMVHQTKEALTSSMKESLDPIPGAFTAFQKANAALSKRGKQAEDAILSQIFKRIGDEKPASIVHMFQRSDGLDLLNRLKKFYRDAATLDMTDFDDQIIQPLRHRYLSMAFDDNTGIFSGQRLTRVLDTMERKNGPEFVEDVFGGKRAAKSIKDAATTMNVVNKTKESDIVMKTLQASMLVGGLTANRYSENDFIQVTGKGLVVIGLAPTALARIFASPTFVRTLTDGFAEGPGSVKFARMATLLLTQNRKAIKELIEKEKSPESFEFYDKPYSEPREESGESAPDPLTFGEMGGTMGLYFPDEVPR